MLIISSCQHNRRTENLTLFVTAVREREILKKGEKKEEKESMKRGERGGDVGSFIQ